ncbi:WD40 repeat domain-containing protein [Thalassoroseus pseudoceratinae]|uniref:WD40 repeat domain-containing protein n=1 Tax=Thalassoroseus pseudoceratinae TaxID=2713176 RepID=UPI00141E7800|nr:hypothetical protein [Thalassoroseus pseudoceratinae]
MKTRDRFRTEKSQSARLSRRGRIALGWLGELCLLATTGCAAIATLVFSQEDFAVPTASTSTSEQETPGTDSAPIYGLSVSSEQGRVMVVRSGRSAQSLNIQPGEMRADESTEDGVTCVEFFPDGERLALGHLDGTVTVRGDGQSDVEVNFPSQEAVVELAFSPDGKRLIIGDEIGNVTIWNLATQQCDGQFRVGTRRIEALATSPDGKYFVATGFHGNIAIRDFETGNVQFEFEHHKSVTCSACVFSKDSSQLICGFVSGELKSYDLKNQEVLWEITADRRQSVLALTLSPDGKSFACGALNPHVWIHDVETGETVNTFPAHRIGVRCVRYIPESNFLVSAGYDGKVRVWHEDDWLPLYRL